MIDVHRAFERETRKFVELESFDLNLTEKYFLLPFKFYRLNEQKEILVNEVGDFLIVPSGVSEKIITKALSKQGNSELYADLIANFFISEERVPPLLDVITTRYRTKKSFLDYFTSLHIFVMTLRCDHRCQYCQVSSINEINSKFDLNKEHLDRGIEFMMNSPNPHVTMEFQGGEPLLVFEAVVYAVEKTKVEAVKNNKQVTYVICTNLSPLTEEVLVYCKNNDILISTSLDGPEFIHNHNRCQPNENSYKLAVQGISKCREVLGAERVSALLTVSSFSLDYPNEIVDEYFKLGFKNIFLRPINPYGYAKNDERKNRYDTSRFIEFYKKALHRIIDYNLRGEFFREEYATIILKKILTPFPVGFVDLQSPSGVINNVIVFNYDGKVYASDESRMLAEMKDYTFQLGNLDMSKYEDIFYGEKAHQISETWINESLPGCSECAFQTYCGADPIRNYATQGDMVGHKPTSSFCQKNMEIIRYLFELMNNNKSIERIFATWTGGGI